MKILVDTCVFLWYVAGSSELPSAIRDQMRDPAHELLLSPVSVWEIVVKHGIGKLPLPEPPAVLVPRERRRHRFSELPLGEGAVLQLARLPDLHRDPFDRMLICQAIDKSAQLCTPDPLIRQYPVAILW